MQVKRAEAFETGVGLQSTCLPSQTTLNDKKSQCFQRYITTTSKTLNVMAVPLDSRVQRMLQERYYDGEGVLRMPINLDKFRKKLAKDFPDLGPNLAEILER
jgi:hypothetical protein